MSKLKTNYLNTIKKHILAYASIRQDIIMQASDARNHSKRAIFAMQRDDIKQGETKIRLAEKTLKQLFKKYGKNLRAMNEGVLRDGIEEYVEASLFYQFLTTGKIGEIKSILIPEEVYIAGLCDVPGELLRYAIKSATIKDEKMVVACADMAAEIVSTLSEFDLTKYLRTKFDQANGAVKKIEYIVYELSLKD